MSAGEQILTPKILSVFSKFVKTSSDAREQKEKCLSSKVQERIFFEKNFPSNPIKSPKWLKSKIAKIASSSSSLASNAVWEWV